MLKDLGELADVPGLDDALKMLKIDHPNVKGFRYEIEGAASLRRGGENVSSITERISVIWNDIEEIGFEKLYGKNTDIDVVTGTAGNFVFHQFKSTAGSMNSLKKVKAWCEKARKERKNILGDYSGLEFHVPSDEIPKINSSVRKFLEDFNIPITPTQITP